MNFYLVSIFPEIFDSFRSTSLINKAVENGLLNVETINPRQYCQDKHKQVDDEIYGGGDGLLMKAIPLIESVEEIIKKIGSDDFKIIYMAPSKNILDQKKCFDLSKESNLILISGRYEGIDFRFEQYLNNKYPGKYSRMSIGKYVMLGGEIPSMVLMESVGRLVSGVINEENSFIDESYNPDKNMDNIEYPQYTRPQDVFGYQVPEVMLSGHHKNIQEWRDSNQIEF